MKQKEIMQKKLKTKNDIIKFVKMEAAGNDFILIYGLTEDEIVNLNTKIPLMCNRHKGIGADGLILISLPKVSKADYRMRIFNVDGSEAEMCGNGIRCVAVYLKEMGITDKKKLSIETIAGIIETEMIEDNVRVAVGVPVLEAKKIPTVKSSDRVVMEPVIVSNKKFYITAVSMGNPHAVVYTNKLTDKLINIYGPRLECHPFFPERVNVEFVKVLSDSEIQVRIYERGCGETMACGTGACASVVAGIINKKHGNNITVRMPGGSLFVAWDGNTLHPVFITGSAHTVFEGDYYM